MKNIEHMTEEELTRNLSYAGFILVEFELLKSMIVNPIKVFYQDTTFDEEMPFTSYERDVLPRHKNQFEACLLYLRDFMEVVNSEDILTIQALRKHRNDLAHDLPRMLSKLSIKDYFPLLENTDKALFKLSNYRTYMDIGSDSEFQNKGIDWNTVEGPEYALFKTVLSKLKILQGQKK